MRFREFNILKEDTFKLDVPSNRIGIEIADLQKVLQALGYDVGPPGIDGILGDYTASAISRAQTDIGLQADGIPHEDFISTLNQVLDMYPDIAKKLTKTSAKEIQKGSNIDVSTIQDPDFNNKLDKIASELGVRSNDLLAIMKQESGVNPKAVNKSSGATGLIQFIPSTAYKLGTSTDELYNMSAVEQLDYVYKYFKMIGIKPGMDLGDLYIAVFYPAALGHDDNHVISSDGHAVYNQNKGLDRNKDGIITVADVKNSVARFA